MKRALLLACILFAGPAAAQQGAPFMAPSSATGLDGVTASSGNVAAGVATATLPAVAGWTTYLCGFSITASGATAGLPVSPTVVGINSGTMTFTYTAPAGVLVPAPPLIVPFTPCQPASAANVAIVVSMPSLGTGNTNASVNAWGYYWRSP